MMESGSGDPAAIGPPSTPSTASPLAANGQFIELVDARAAQLREEWLRISAIGGALSLLALISVVALVRQGVIGPLRRMTEALGRLADGDIATEVPATRFDDEIATLGEAMRRFKQALEGLPVAVAYGGAIDHAGIRRHRPGRGGHRPGVGRRPRSDGVGERLRHSFLETREAMKEVAAVTRTGQERSRDAADRLEESLTDIDAMSAAVREIADMSSEINRVTVAIGKLAAHSNILSLNASIEASRAGEHGRGFSVVAGAVGTLAQQTLGLAQEIAGLASRSHDRIARGLEVAAAVGQRMQEVSITIAETDSLSQIIVDQVARQRESVGGIEAALIELSDFPRQRIRRPRRSPPQCAASPH